MLRFLSIRNLAVIEAADLEFEQAFNVLTGETGAGKSILVGAVGLLLGGRAASDLVRTGEDAAVIQAIFELPGADRRELVVRREITSQGRSRAFVDGALVSASTLKEMASGLVELHGQHEHQALLDAGSHLDLLDEHGGLSVPRARTAAAHADLTGRQSELDALRLDAREKAARIDLLTFQAAEIDRVAPRAGEDEELAATRQVLANADRLQRLCAESYASLYESDAAALPTLASVWRRVSELASLDPRFSPYLDERDGIKSQLEELAQFLRDYGRGIDASPARLEQVEDRLAQIERLERKYGPTLADVLRKREECARQLAALQTSAERREELESALEDARRTYFAEARALSRARREASAVFSRALERLLRDLAMEQTRFEVRFGGGEVVTARGIDTAEFFISPNPGEDLRPLARIASGGELSRIMLALKMLSAVSSPGTTLVFDEVDAGIGGRVADVVGRNLQALGRRFQVLCITHLPQIAAYATTHFSIEKAVRRGRTVTRVSRLDRHERIAELARMMAGECSDRALAGAEELLTRGGGGGETEEKSKGESESASARTRPSRRSNR
jgi:DNA repair protein RecN (Recombination protein N)